MKWPVQFSILFILIIWGIIPAGCTKGNNNATTPPAHLNLDTTFGGSGMVTTNAYSRANAVALQTDGKIVAAGHSGAKNVVTFALVRYNSDGKLDESFGINGLVRTDVEGQYNAAHSVAIQADGKIVAAGNSYSYIKKGYNFAMVRYTPDGGLDPSFGNSGKVTADFGTDSETAYAIAIQSDGKIAAGGGLTLARFNSDGTLDATFGTNGKVTTNFWSYCIAYTVIIQADGKIVVGHAGIGSSLARYNTDGSLDMDFGTNGILSPVFFISAAIQADGKIVVAGYDFIVERYDSNGSLDSTFGINGRVAVNLGTGSYNAYAVGIQTDGKIVVAGGPALVRYNTDGVRDLSFGRDGIVMNESIMTRAAVLQPDGKLVVVGSDDDNHPGSIAVARYIM